jgi:hypothetical protein
MEFPPMHIASFCLAGGPKAAGIRAGFYARRLVRCLPASAMICLALATAAPATTLLSLTNADFQTGTGVPTGWTGGGDAPNNVVLYRSGGGIPSGESVLGVKRVNNWVQQSFLTSEATADTFDQFTVTFDSGWRNNLSPTNNLDIFFQIVDVSVTPDTAGFVLAEAEYDFPLTVPDNQRDVYRVIQTGNTVTMSYDNTLPSLAGNEIALRIITSDDTVNSWDPTGWVDNVSVVAVPEPSTVAVFAGMAIVPVFLRLRRRGG